MSFTWGITMGIIVGLLMASFGIEQALKKSIKNGYLDFGDKRYEIRIK